MGNSTAKTEDKVKFSKLLSSLLCSVSIMGFSFLCLLNNLSFDIYSAMVLLKVVIPASFCCWFIGFAIGHILDNHDTLKIFKSTDDDESEDAAYEIPSMFSSDIPDTGDEFGDI